MILFFLMMKYQESEMKVMQYKFNDEEYRKI